jgi:hypothetical protein
MKTQILFLIVLLCAVVAGVHSTHANTITVTNTNDSGRGSLRKALAAANDGDTIDATGVSGTILLTNGALQITHNVTINGPGAGNLAVNGNAISTVFENFAAGVTISGFTITNGKGGGIYNQGGGLRLKNCSVVSNVGGGIHNNATLTITNCTVSGNSNPAGFFNPGAGGGISNIASGGSSEGVSRLTVSNSTISGNSASSGGGIYNETRCFSQVCGGGATVAISNSTLSGNSATNGGGIYNSGSANSGHATVAISNSTLSGNKATGRGGAIFNDGVLGPASVHVSNCTISGNNSNAGGFAELELGSTILKVGSSGHNIFNNGGTVTSLGYNLSSDDGGGFLTGPGDQINTNPMLGPLQDNGGPTFTHALLPGSPAINAGNPNFAPPPSFDQRGRGYPRVVDGRIDIGSFEVQNNP